MFFLWLSVVRGGFHYYCVIGVKVMSQISCYFHSYHTLTNLMCYYSIKTSCPYFWLSVVSRFFYIRIVTGGVLLPDKGKAEGATVHRTISKAD